MLLRNTLAMMVCLGILLSAVSPARAGLIRAVKDKHKANPDSLHAKLQATIKDHKAYSGHHHGKPK